MDNDNNIDLGLSFDIKKYMVIDCNNDYFLSEFANYENALNYYNDLKRGKFCDEKIRLIEFRELESVDYD